MTPFIRRAALPLGLLGLLGCAQGAPGSILVPLDLAPEGPPAMEGFVFPSARTHVDEAATADVDPSGHALIDGAGTADVDIGEDHGATDYLAPELREGDYWDFCWTLDDGTEVEEHRVRIELTGAMEVDFEGRTITLFTVVREGELPPGATDFSMLGSMDGRMVGATPGAAPEVIFDPEETEISTGFLGYLPGALTVDEGTTTNADGEVAGVLRIASGGAAEAYRGQVGFCGGVVEGARIGPEGEVPVRIEMRLVETSLE